MLLTSRNLIQSSTCCFSGSQLSKGSSRPNSLLHSERLSIDIVRLPGVQLIMVPAVIISESLHHLHIPCYTTLKGVGFPVFVLSQHQLLTSDAWQIRKNKFQSCVGKMSMLFMMNNMVDVMNLFQFCLLVQLNKYFHHHLGIISSNGDQLLSAIVHLRINNHLSSPFISKFSLWLLAYLAIDKPGGTYNY